MSLTQPYPGSYLLNPNVLQFVELKQLDDLLALIAKLGYPLMVTNYDEDCNNEDCPKIVICDY